MGNVNLQKADFQKIEELLSVVKQQHDLGVKCSLEAELTIGRAKVYHMGINNPDIRIDIRMGDK